MEIYLRDEFETLWRGKDPFVEVEKISGQILRSKEGRITMQFRLDGRGYFLKLHKGIGWREIAKNLFQFRFPVLGAKNEQRASLVLSQIGVGTLSVAAYGEKGVNPAQKTSFIITYAIEPSTSLEDVALQWRNYPPEPKLKRAVLRRVCEMTHLMHANHINHRDLYICHFLWRQYPGTSSNTSPDLALIDLHRALIHKKLPYRWRIKDLASLYYSVMDEKLTVRERLRFIREYSQKPLHRALKEDAAMWRDVERKARKLHAKAIRKGI